MSKIAVMSTYYLGLATANGICARNIVNELNNIGHSIDIICYKEDNNLNIPSNVHTIENGQLNNEGSIYRITSKLRKGIQLLLDNIDAALDKRLVKQYYDELEKINNKECIDAVLAMFFPLESVEALRLFKKSHPNVKGIIYELDSIGDGVAQTGIQILYNRLYEKWLKNVYKTIDFVFIMQSHEDYWKAKFGHQFSKKLKIVDIPVLTEKIHSREEHDKVVQGTSMIYAGLIEKKYRSPSYLLEVLNELNKTMDFKFAFYSKGDCENEIEEATKRMMNMTQNGYVSQHELDAAIDNADVLVSIGNSVSRSVPSKIITYLSYGKPIIHFSSQKNDVCNEYFEKYSLALVIDQSMPKEEASKLVDEFIAGIKGKTIDFADIKKMFYLNLPSYSSKMISSILDCEDR